MEDFSHWKGEIDPKMAISPHFAEKLALVCWRQQLSGEKTVES